MVLCYTENIFLELFGIKLKTKYRWRALIVSSKTKQKIYGLNLFGAPKKKKKKRREINNIWVKFW